MKVVKSVQFTEMLAVEDTENVYDSIPTIEKIMPDAKELSMEVFKNENKSLKYLHLGLKRIVDILAGIVGCVTLVPLMAVVLIINKIYNDDGPLFYVQDRIGKDGKLFKMIKFRSMCVDADEKLEKFLQANPDVKEEFEIYKKIKKDPRITKAGKLLRKTSLDEWPQFLLILTGKMSLVGPRPYLPREKEDMAEYYDIIVQDKPRINWTMAG